MCATPFAHNKQGGKEVYNLQCCINLEPIHRITFFEPADGIALVVGSLEPADRITLVDVGGRLRIALLEPADGIALLEPTDRITLFEPGNRVALVEPAYGITLVEPSDGITLVDIAG